MLANSIFAKTPKDWQQIARLRCNVTSFSPKTTTTTTETCCGLWIRHAILMIIKCNVRLMIIKENMILMTFYCHNSVDYVADNNNVACIDLIEEAVCNPRYPFADYH